MAEFNDCTTFQRRSFNSRQTNRYFYKSFRHQQDRCAMKMIDLKPGFHIVVSVVRKKIIGEIQLYGTSRTTAQYNRNDRYNVLYEIEWILSVLWFFFVRQTRQIRQIQRYGNQALNLITRPQSCIGWIVPSPG